MKQPRFKAKNVKFRRDGNVITITLDFNDDVEANIAYADAAYILCQGKAIEISMDKETIKWGGHAGLTSI